jgi:hypothetical protein
MSDASKIEKLIIKGRISREVSDVLFKVKVIEALQILAMDLGKSFSISI